MMIIKDAYRMNKNTNNNRAMDGSTRPNVLRISCGVCFISAVTSYDWPVKRRQTEPTEAIE
jgi:hypothetical protein